MNEWEINKVTDFLNTSNQLSGLQIGEETLWWKGNIEEVYKVNVAYHQLNQFNYQILNWLWKVEILYSLLFCMAISKGSCAYTG